MTKLLQASVAPHGPRMTTHPQWWLARQSFPSGSFCMWTWWTARWHCRTEDSPKVVILKGLYKNHLRIHLWMAVAYVLSRGFVSWHKNKNKNETYDMFKTGKSEEQWQLRILSSSFFILRKFKIHWPVGVVTLWLFNIAMENDSSIDDFPIKTSIYSEFSMAMLDNQMVNLERSWFEFVLFTPACLDPSWAVQDLQLLSKFASSPTSGALLQGVTQRWCSWVGDDALEEHGMVYPSFDKVWLPTTHRNTCSFQMCLINIGTTGFTRVNWTIPKWWELDSQGSFGLCGSWRCDAKRRVELQLLGKIHHKHLHWVGFDMIWR